jgi:hypothetical protein
MSPHIAGLFLGKGTYMEKKTITIAVIIATIVAFAAPTAFAATDTSDAPKDNAYKQAIESADNQIGFHIELANSNYQEKITPGPSDTESGLIPGYGLSAKGLFDVGPVHNIFVDVTGNYRNGYVSYQTGGYGFSASHYSDLGVEAKIGKGFFLDNSRVLLTPYLFGGYRNWNRQVLGGISPEEDYHNFYVGIGGMAQYAATRRLVLSVNAGVGEVLGAGMDANTQNIASEVDAFPYYGNVPSDVHYGLGSRPFYQAGIGADYRITKHLHLTLAADYEHFGYGASSVHTFTYNNPWSAFFGGPATQSFGLSEPSSTTGEFVVDAGLGYSF